MPLTDNFMLPRRVRTMEQMADLLQAEETELAQAQRVIDAMSSQLAVGTSTFLLPRHERIFGLPVNTEESLEVRRARVMARLNARGVTTVRTILEMVRLITGREGDVREHFADYSFSVAVRLLFKDSTKDLQELIRQIDEIKPAHLLFDTIGSVQPAVLENKNRLLFVNQSLLLRMSNLDGTWQLAQRFTRGAAFYRLQLSLGAGNRYGQALAWVVCGSVCAPGKLGLAHMQVCRFSANNLGIEETLLNGKRSLDGVWYLTAAFNKGVSLSRFTWSCGDMNRNQTAAAHRLRVQAVDPHKWTVKAVYRAFEKNVQGTRRQGFRAAVHARNPQSTGGSITAQRDHRLNGVFLLNGARKLNAGTTKEEL